jgi:hypothetical protein
LSASPAEADEVTYPNKTWQISGQDAYILADEASQTYYLTTTGGPFVRQSKNLVDWSNNTRVYTIPSSGVWMRTTSPWACEMHLYNGRYYLLATFHNSNTVLALSQLATEPDPYSLWQSQWARATCILEADSPLGPFDLLDPSGPVHDPHFMTLDGTLHIDPDGTPWMVYAHEWIQKMDGTIEAIPLTEDLTSAAGDPILICRGSDSYWRTHPVYSGARQINEMQLINCVTDGPQLYYTPSGYLLMLWTGPGGSQNYEGYNYIETQAISRSGSIRGPWEQIPRGPLAVGNRGHGMLFRTFEGQDMFLVMNRSASGGLGSGTRMEFYEVEITDEGVNILSHRADLDGQLGMNLEDTTAPELWLPPNQVVNATGPNGTTLTFTAMARDWHDGPIPLNSSHASGSTFDIGHTTVTCWAEDKAGNLATDSFNVHVKGAAEQIEDQIELVLLAGMQGTSYVDQLKISLSLLAEGQGAKACNQLLAFMRLVRAQTGKQLSVSLATDLLANVTRIIDVISA